MADPITLQKLIDASLDSDTFEVAVNGDAQTDVTARLGATYPSVQKAIRLMTETGISFTPFETKAQMTASAKADGTYAVVTNDTAANIGVYLKKSGTWTLVPWNNFSNLDSLRINKGKDYPLKKMSRGGVVSTEKLNENSLFLAATVINAQPNSYYGIRYYRNGYTGDSKSGDGWIISRADKSTYVTTGVETNIITVNDGALMPKLTRDGVQTIFLKAPRSPEIIKLTIDTTYLKPVGQWHGWNDTSTSFYSWIIDESNYIFEDTGALETIRPLLSNSVVSNQVLSDLSIELGGSEKQGYYLLDSTGVDTATVNKPYLTVSPLLIIDRSQAEIRMTAHGFGFIAAYAFYDKDKKFITASNGNGSGDQSITVAMSNVPALAKYIKYTGNIDKNTGIFAGAKPNASIDDFVTSRIDNKIAGIKPDVNLSTIFITGASFTYSGNAWFGLANERLGTTGINKARSGVGRPALDSWDLWRGILLTDAEFEAIDVFCFQYSSTENIDGTAGLKSTAADYVVGFDPSSETNPFLVYNEGQQMDFLLKFLQDKCYAQRNNASSKWYGSEHGKPFRGMLITSWHDARLANSASVRNLAQKWGFAVCEFDKKIGFSRNTPLIDGKQASLLYAMDSQVIDGITYGWHPKRTEGSDYIQNRIASIFTQSVVEWFGY